MIRFELEKLHVRYVMLKACTTALGGSVRIVDELATAADARGREIYRKMDVPMALIRAFVQKHKTSQYLKPVPAAITTYDNHVVAIERHPLGSVGTLEEDIRHSGLFDEGPSVWRSQSERNIQESFRQLVNKPDATIGGNAREWFIDGKYIWSFEENQARCVQKAEWLSSDGKFRKVDVDAIKLADIGDTAKLGVTTRQCLAFVPSRTTPGEPDVISFSISPPVWKTLQVADKQLSGVSQDDGATAKDKKYRFDEIDEWLAVNLNFVLKAGKELGQIFGPEIMEPLNMPKLMVQLETVNLPSVANSVKSTFDTGIRFTHACAWLIGLVSRTNTFESYMVLRSLLKYVTQKGIFRKHLFLANQVFKDGYGLTNVPVKSKEQARTTAETPTIEEWVRRQKARGETTMVVGTDMGTMVDDEIEDF